MPNTTRMARSAMLSWASMVNSSAGGRLRRTCHRRMSARAPARARSPFAWAQLLRRRACVEPPFTRAARLVIDGTFDALVSTMRRILGIGLATTNSVVAVCAAPQPPGDVQSAPTPAKTGVVDAELEGASP